MFERYSESARRALFFARYAVTQLGGLTIEPEHLVLGVIKASPQTVLRFTRDAEAAETLRASLERASTQSDKVATTVEIPFSLETKAVLEDARIEADDLGNRGIVPEHLILGLILKTHGAAARALRDAGVDPNAIRDYLRTSPEPPDEPPETAARMIAFAAQPGAIVRQWKGVVKRGKAVEYVRHLREETIAALTEMDGFLTFSIMRRDVEDGTEFQVLTIWRSLDAIKAFAGEDVTRAVVPPAAQALMVRYDDRAVHYDVVQ